MRGRPAQLLLLLALGGCWSDAATPTDLREIGVDEIEPLSADVGFSNVRDVVADGGAIWVLDGAPPFLTRVSAMGGDVRRFGDEGQGPTEFTNPWAMIADSQGVRVWDLGNRRLMAVSDDGVTTDLGRLGEASGSRLRANIREVSYADPFRVRTWGERIAFSYYPGAVDRTADIANGSLQWADDRMEPEGQIFAYSDHLNGRSGLGEWASLPFWDVCEGTLVVWSPAESGLLWMDARGGVLARTAVELKPPKITVSDVEAYLRWMGRLELGPGYEERGIDYSGMAARTRDRFAQRAPVATDLRCESGHVAWIRLFETAFDPLGRGRTWVRVEQSGTVTGVTFPAHFTPYLFAGEDVVGVLTPPDGPQELARWLIAAAEIS